MEVRHASFSCICKNSYEWKNEIVMFIVQEEVMVTEEAVVTGTVKAMAVAAMKKDMAAVMGMKKGDTVGVEVMVMKRDTAGVGAAMDMRKVMEEEAGMVTVMKRDMEEGAEVTVMKRDMEGVEVMATKRGMEEAEDMDTAKDMATEEAMAKVMEEEVTEEVTAKVMVEEEATAVATAKVTGEEATVIVITMAAMNLHHSTKG